MAPDVLSDITERRQVPPSVTTSVNGQPVSAAAIHTPGAAQLSEIHPPAPEQSGSQASVTASYDGASSSTTLHSSVVNTPTTGDSLRAPNQSGLATSSHAFLNQYTNVERTNTSYELCYIDGFPYLVKAAGRAPRLSRRARNPANAHVQDPRAPATVPTTASASDSHVPTAPVRHHQVDLPATAAIPVRTADGRRALILSPEGVRAMAAQGVNIETNLRSGPFGISSATIRSFMSNGVPHGWLIFKLAFLVTMLGSNSTWPRFLLLNVIAVGIFFWQSGILGRGLGRAVPVPGQAAPVPPVGRPQGPVDATGNDPLETLAVSRTNVGVQNAAGTFEEQLPASTRWIRTFTNAFISSIVPGSPRPDEGRLRGPVRPETNEVLDNTDRAPMQPAVAASSTESSVTPTSTIEPSSAQGSATGTSSQGERPTEHGTSQSSSSSYVANIDHGAEVESQVVADEPPMLDEHMRRDW